MVTIFIGINATVNYISAIMYNMAHSFVGVLRHFQQCVSYNVQHGDQFYWCLTTFNNVRYNVEHGDQFYWY